MASNKELQDLKKQVSLLRVAQQRVRLEQRGNEYWGCCPFHDENTASFAIKIKETGEEVFFCQGCSKGGDVIRFIEYADGINTAAAIKKLKEIGGWSEKQGDQQANAEWKEDAAKVEATFHPITDESSKPKITIPLARYAATELALKGNKAALDYLLAARGITPETAFTLRLGYIQTVGPNAKIPPEFEHVRDQGWISFPRIEGDKVVAIKFRSIIAKAFVQQPHMNVKALFNTPTINSLEPVFVTEGEYDTAVMEQAGFRAVSIANANTKVTPEYKKLLKNAECVYLAGDNDGGVGTTAMRQLQTELCENTYMLVWPDGVKDANEFFLKKCGRDVAKFRTEVERLAGKARNTPIVGFTSLLERLRNTGGTDAGADPNRLHFPIEALDRMNYNPPGSIVVFYSTYSGTGKTIFTTQVMLHEAKRGEVVVVYSPELRDEQYLALVAAQTLGERRLADTGRGINRAAAISQADYEETANSLDVATERGTPFTYYVGHSLPETDTDKVLEFIETTIRVTGATRFVIDTLHRVIAKGGRESQTEAEGRVVKALEALGIKYGTIFVLIGQSNKEAEDIKEQRKDSYGILRGSRELIDVSYGIYLLHRKRKPAAPGASEILELETACVLMKDRGKGPGNANVPLHYQPTTSRFYLLERNESGNMNQGSESTPPPISDEESPF